ncbi:DNA replication/repair protein RecF [Lacticigenium naphthae]|uniref:DNA replication/repair protein RecF n=1 Tax=Lacticigenium naphthae TaxID=515351 RepID=UPI0004193FB6|nr:DNA replication/repair protein RecF [Lacticigenium naphthae]
MFLEAIELKNYRNYEKVEVSFSNGINIFLGENAQGKTNLMESLYVLAMSRSHRTTNDKELIRWQADFAKISGRVQKKNSSFPLEIVLSKKGKKARFNHLEQKKLSDYIGHLNVILFAPEDLSLVKGSPSVRRKFLDMEMGQMSGIYLHHLVQYQKILKQRNHYLKQIKQGRKVDEVFLDILTEQLSLEGAEVLKERYRFTKRLETWARPIHSEISSHKEELTIHYQSSVSVQSETDKDQLFTDLINNFKKIKKREREQGTTLAGPHRDDMLFYVNEKNVQTYGSQGQQRTTALSIKLAEIDLMKEMTGEYPLLLLDDVLSELDDERQTHLLKAIQNKVQTFLTTTSLSGIKHKLIDVPKIFRITDGQVEMESE